MPLVFINKSLLVPSQCVLYLGFGIDSVRHCFTFFEVKKEKFIALLDCVLSADQVDVKTLQRFAGKCISFSYAVPALRLFTSEVNLAISRGLRASRAVRVSSHLRQKLEHCTFLKDWQDCLPWFSGFNAQIQLASEVSSFA